MKIRYKEISYYLLSVILLLSFFYFSINFLTNKDPEIINFIDSDIHEDFELEITNNLDDINNFLKEYLFIEKYLLKRKNNEIFIQLKIKQPFAINNFTREIIFTDNTKAPFSYFKLNYLKSHLQVKRKLSIHYEVLDYEIFCKPSNIVRAQNDQRYQNLTQFFLCFL